MESNHRLLGVNQMLIPSAMDALLVCPEGIEPLAATTLVEGNWFTASRVEQDTGARRRDRTDNLLITKQVLCLLSFAGVVRAWVKLASPGLRQRTPPTRSRTHLELEPGVGIEPTSPPYQGGAKPISYPGDALAGFEPATQSFKGSCTTAVLQGRSWSGHGESNPGLELGRLRPYH